MTRAIMRRAGVVGVSGVVAVVALVPVSCTQTVSTSPTGVDTTAATIATTSAPTTSAPATALPTTSSSSTTSPTGTLSTARVAEELDAGALAVELTAVERAAAAGDGSVGVRQQLLYRYLSAHADLDAAVLGAAGDDVRPFISRIVTARQFSQERSRANPSTTPPSDTLPAWTIIDPLPADELLAEYRGAEATTGIPWYWLAAIHLQETRMGRIVGVSSAGAVGPMQFLPATWQRCCTGDPTVTHDAILGAATYLSQSGGPADMSAALHTYNPNDSYVSTVTAFAENLRDNPQLLAAYHQWQVFYATSAGTVRLPVGYAQSTPVDADDYLLDHPEDRAG